MIGNILLCKTIKSTTAKYIESLYLPLSLCYLSLPLSAGSPVEVDLTEKQISVARLSLRWPSNNPAMWNPLRSDDGYDADYVMMLMMDPIHHH